MWTFSIATGCRLRVQSAINNESGQRPYESAIGKTYGSCGASCHTSNTKRFPDAKSFYLSEQLASLLRRLEGSPVLPLRFDEVYIDSIGGQAIYGYLRGAVFDRRKIYLGGRLPIYVDNYRVGVWQKV